MAIQFLQKPSCTQNPVTTVNINNTPQTCSETPIKQANNIIFGGAGVAEMFTEETSLTGSIIGAAVFVLLMAVGTYIWIKLDLPFTWYDERIKTWLRKRRERSR